jgi:site-specific DNA-methyltransferase (adenine-specific)
MNTLAQSNGHSAVFPAELINPRILSSCPVGGVVLDPFCGTGTVIAEALRLERRALGFEKNAKYAEDATREVFGEEPSAAVCGNQSTETTSDGSRV